MPFYNEIQDIGDSYILWKNPNIQSSGRTPFKDMQIEWGYDPSRKRILIKSMIYPKSKYSLEKVKQIGRETKDCVNCVEGKPIDIPKSLYNKNPHTYLTINNNKNNFEEDNMSFKFQLPKIPGIPKPKKVSTKGFSITKYADPLFGAKLSEQLLAQTYSQLIQMLVGFAVPEKVMQKVIKIIAGIIITTANELGMNAGRLKDEMRIIGTNMLTSAIDPDLEDINRMQREVINIQSRLQFSNPLDFLRMSFQDPVQTIQRIMSETQSAIRQAGINLGGAAGQLMLSPFQLGGVGSPFLLGTNIGRNPNVVTPIRPNLIQNQTSRVSQRVPGGKEITGFRINATLNEKSLR